MQYRTYYVSSETGNDCYDGLSKTTPFATLKRFQQCKLYPGDQILLECGSVFEDQYLHIPDSGSKELPIEIGAAMRSSYLFFNGTLLGANIIKLAVRKFLIDESEYIL